MGDPTFIERVREWLGGVGWKLFLWGIRKTEEQYWEEIYEQEKAWRTGGRG